MIGNVSALRARRATTEPMDWEELKRKVRGLESKLEVSAVYRVDVASRRQDDGRWVPLLIIWMMMTTTLPFM